MELALPQTNAEMLPFAVGVATVLWGLVALFAPRLVMRGLGLPLPAPKPQGLAEVRSMMGGLPIGVGIGGIMFFDQPIVQMMLGLAWALAAFGRLVSILSDRSGGVVNVLLLLVQCALAAAPLAGAFGLVATWGCGGARKSGKTSELGADPALSPRNPYARGSLLFRAGVR